MSLTFTGPETVLSYLTKMTSFFEPPMCPIERLVLRCGKDFVGVRRPRGIRKQANQQCFKNAATLVLHRDDLDYVEGYAIHDGLSIPVFHAWTARSNRAIDPTWRYPERSEYRGVVIPRSLLIRSLARNRVYGVLDPGRIDLDIIQQLG